MPFPTNSSIELTEFVLKGLDRIFVKGIHYKKAGVIVKDITPDNPQHKPLMKTIDELNNSIGQQKNKLGSQD